MTEWRWHQGAWEGCRALGTLGHPRPEAQKVPSLAGTLRLYLEAGLGVS